MLYSDKLIHITTLGDWTLNFYESDGSDGTYLCTAIDLYLEGTKRGRIALVRPGLAADQVVAQLMERASKWIAEYESRSHSGTTGFGSL